MRANTRTLGTSTRRSSDRDRAANYALGRHMTVEVYDCDPAILADASMMEKALLAAASRR